MQWKGQAKCYWMEGKTNEDKNVHFQPRQMQQLQLKCTSKYLIHEQPHLLQPKWVTFHCGTLLRHNPSLAVTCPHEY
jgi:hypothetical protein